MADAPGSVTDTKTDTAPIAGPFYAKHSVERGFKEVVTMTIETTSERPMYKLERVGDAKDPVTTDGSPEVVGSYISVPTDEVVKTTTRTTCTLSPITFKIDESFEDSHVMPTAKKPCGCQEAGGGGGKKSFLEYLVEALPAVAPMLAQFLGGATSAGPSPSGAPAETAPSYYWVTYCSSKGIDPSKRATEDELKDFEAWMKDAAVKYVDFVRQAQANDPDPSTEH